MTFEIYFQNEIGLIISSKKLYTNGFNWRMDKTQENDYFSKKNFSSMEVY